MVHFFRLFQFFIFFSIVVFERCEIVIVGIVAITYCTCYSGIILTNFF